MNESKSSLKHVLIVDDDEESCTFFEMVLTREGYAVHSVFNGKDALALLKEGSLDRFDVVLMDLMLPGYGGYEILEELKNPGYKQVPVIVVTARALDSETFGKLRAAVLVRGILNKPVDLSEFKQKVREITNKKI